MKIWLITNASPQCIGSTNGLNTTKELIEAAHATGHTIVKIVCKATCGDKVHFYAFSKMRKFTEFKNRHTDIKFLEFAILKP